MNDLKPGSDGLGILGDFWKKAVSSDLNQDEASWFFGPGRGQSSYVSMRCAARGGVRWNSQHSKNCVSLSPRFENLKVKKVIKVSYLNKESRQCFSYFGIPMHKNVLYIRIFVYFTYSRITAILQLCDWWFHLCHRIAYICCFVSSYLILTLIWLVIMVLFCAAIWRDSISLIKFPFLSYVQVLSCEMLFINHLKRP